MHSSFALLERAIDRRLSRFAHWVFDLVGAPQSLTQNRSPTLHAALRADSDPCGGIRLNGLVARCLQLHREAGADEQRQWPRVVQRAARHPQSRHAGPLNACTASRTCSGDIMAQVLVSSVLIIMSAIDTRRSGSANQRAWCRTTDI